MQCYKGAQIGTNKTANIGIVPNEVPIPIVINKPSSNIINDVIKSKDEIISKKEIKTIVKKSKGEF